MYLIEGINNHDHNCSLQKPGTQTTGVSNVGQPREYPVKTNKQTKNRFSKPNASNTRTLETKAWSTWIYVPVPDMVSRTQSLVFWDSLSYELPKWVHSSPGMRAKSLGPGWILVFRAFSAGRLSPIPCLVVRTLPEEGEPPTSSRWERTQKRVSLRQPNWIPIFLVSELLTSTHSQKEGEV